MKPTSSDTAQTSFLHPDLEKQLDPRRLLYRSAQAIDWKCFDKTFGALYCSEGRPALPIRRIVGLLLLKSLRNLSDEEVVEFWSESAYAQYFCRGAGNALGMTVRSERVDAFSQTYRQRGSRADLGVHD